MATSGNKRKANEKLEENNNTNCELTEKRARVMEQPQTVTPNTQQQMYYQSMQPVILDQNMVLQQNIGQNHQHMSLQQNIGLQQSCMVQQNLMHHQQQPNNMMQHQSMIPHGLVQQNVGQNIVQSGFSQDGSVPGGLQLNQLGQLVYQPQVQYVQASQHGYGAIGSNYGQIMMQNGMGLSQNGLQHIQNGLQPGIQRGLQQGIQQGIQQGVQHGLHSGLQQGLQPGISQTLQPGLHHNIQPNVQQIPQSYQTNFTYAQPITTTTQPQIVQTTHPELLQTGNQSVHTQSMTSVNQSFNHLTNHQNLTLNQYQSSPQFRQSASSIPLLQPLSNHPIVPNPTGMSSIMMMQKRKKPSPSARRRSRMRLLAFIEAKKKSADELEALEGKVDGSSDAILDSTLDGNLDGNSESTSSDNFISSQVSEIGKDELKNSKEADRSSICTGT